MPAAAKVAWARLITQVYEVDPLVCSRCAGPMRIIAFIEQPAVIDLPVLRTADREDLRHLAVWPATAHSPPGVPDTPTRPKRPQGGRLDSGIEHGCHGNRRAAPKTKFVSPT